MFHVIKGLYRYSVLFTDSRHAPRTLATRMDYQLPISQFENSRTNMDFATSPLTFTGSEVHLMLDTQRNKIETELRDIMIAKDGKTHMVSFVWRCLSISMCYSNANYANEPV